MNNLEFEIFLDEASNRLTNELDAIIIESMIYMEAGEDNRRGIIALINRMTNAFYDYLQDIKKLNDFKKIKKEVDSSLKIYEKAIKKFPDWENKKISLAVIPGDVIGDKQHKIDKSSYLNIDDMMVRIKTINDNSIQNIMNEYIKRKKAYAGYFNVPAKYACKVVLQYSDLIDKNITECENNIKKFSAYIKDADIDHNEMIDAMKSMIEIYKDDCETNLYKCKNNISVLKYSIGSSIENTMRIYCSIFFKNTPFIKDDKKMMENSKFVKKLSIGDVDFNIYEMPEENTICFNYKGFDVYVNKGFFNLPEAVQLGVLYHEVGHFMQGHFDNDHVGVEQRETIKKLKKKLFMFHWSVWNSSWTNEPILNNNAELVYILVENEADEYASNIIGKSAYKNGVGAHINSSLMKAANGTNNKLFNKFRNDTRMKMMN